VCSLECYRQVASQLMCGRVWLRTLVAGFSPLTTEFDPGPMHVGECWTGWLWDRSDFERACISSFAMSVSFHQNCILLFISVPGC